MKYVAGVAPVVGICFGLFILPVVFAVLVLRTHFLNLRKLRHNSAAPPRWRLLTYNLLLLGAVTLGAAMMYSRDEHIRHNPVGIAAMLALGLASFGVSALYLSLPKALRGSESVQKAAQPVEY